MDDLEVFLQNWGEDSPEVKELFSQLYDLLRDCPFLTLRWEAEPGVAYSLRGALKNAPDGGLPGDAFRIDIVDDDPEERWLSIRLDAVVAGDPGGAWEALPGALFGRDALCLDVNELDDEITVALPELFKSFLAKLSARAT